MSPAILMGPPIPVRFENLAQDRKKQLEILQLAQAQGLDPPSHHFELKTFQTVRCQSPSETVAPCWDRTGEELGVVVRMGKAQSCGGCRRNSRLGGHVGLRSVYRLC